MRERDISHIYTIGANQGYFDAGTTRDGQQVLIGLCYTGLAAIYFDPSGSLLGSERRPLVLPTSEEPAFNIHRAPIAPQLETWQNEMGFRPETVRVRRFSIPDLGIRIEDYPDHFAEILADPKASDLEKEDVLESMTLWDEDGQFVLFWGNDYWLDHRGKVVAS